MRKNKPARRQVTNAVITMEGSDLHSSPVFGSRLHARGRMLTLTPLTCAELWLV